MRVKRRLGQEKWFSENVQSLDAFGFSLYRQSEETRRRLGFVRRISHTKVTNLVDTQEILEALSPKTAYEIRRARRLGVVFCDSGLLAEFVPFFNAFAATKGLATRLKEKSLSDFSGHIRITRAELDGDPLVMHLYIVDDVLSRARLLYSASRLRATNPADSKVIGFANRFLHYEDMCFFSTIGIRRYDLGGYAHGTSDPELVNINRFKDEFGAVLLKEGNYMSLPYLIAVSIARLLSRIPG